MEKYSQLRRFKISRIFSFLFLFVLFFVSENILAAPYDGIWIGRAIPSTSSCSSADVNIVVDGTQINGTAIDTTFLEVFSVTGSVNTNGTISNGAFALGDKGTSANFTGSFGLFTASGSWNSTDGCFGTFELSLIASYDSGFYELWNGTLISTSGSGCGSGTVTLTVYKNIEFSLRGHAVSSFNEYYAIIGNITGSSFSGAAGSYSYTFGTYSGSFAGNTASGTWSDTGGCSGTFQMSLSIRNLDTDTDGIIDSIDTDDDNDGITDVNDAFPLDPSESVDIDEDGTGNNADADDDGDGIIDSNDAFPLDSSESVDTDGDGTGNNADTDDDGDGVIDSNDAFPLDSSESVDTDGDGIGNNTDTDDDGDGIIDSYDAFPLDSSESVDTDGDGIGNNTDTDDDGDGVSDEDELNIGRNPLVNESSVIMIIFLE